MSVVLEYIQYDEIIAKLNELLNRIADKETQLQIKSLIETIQSLMSKESKQDVIISRLDEVLSKINSIMSALGEPKPTYVATLIANAVGANRIHFVLFNGSDKRITIRRIVVNAEVTATVTGFQISLRLHRITAYTGGTQLAIQKHDPNDPDPTNILALSNATGITSIGILDSFTVNPEETAGQHTIERTYGVNGTKPIVIPPNGGIAIQQYGTTGVGSITIIVVFTVE